MSDSERARSAARKTALAAALAALAGWAVPAAAQTAGAPASRSAPRLVVDVHLARGWFGPSSPLSVEVSVTSRSHDPMPGLRATLAMYERVRSRSDLRGTWTNRLPRTPLQTFTYPLDDLAPGAGERIKVDQDLAALPAFEGAPDGVYPLAVTVRQLTGPVIASAVTAAAFITGTPRPALQLVPVLALVPRPTLGPDGRATRSTRGELQELRRRLGGLPVVGVPFGLAVSPVLLDELRALHATSLRTDAAALEGQLHAVAAGAELLTVPYAYADLPHLPELAGPGAVRQQIDSGRTTTRRGLGADPVSVLYPPGLSLDARTLASAKVAGVDGAIVPGSSLTRETRGPTPADPASVGGLHLLPADYLLQNDLLDARTDLDLSRLVADTAMVYFESPARQRTLVITAPVGLRAHRFAAFLAAVQDAPWLDVMGPREAAASVTRTMQNVRFPAPSRPSRTFVRSLQNASRSVEQLGAFTVQGNPVTIALRASLQTALSTAWWDDDWSRGTAWTRGIVAAVDGERRRVSTVGGASVTFTSRRGEVPITIVNRTGYPVRIRVDLSSPKLRFPQGSSRVLEPLDPPGRTLTFPALAEATGTFPLKVRLTSPDGAVIVHEDELVVRSTAYNVVALGITGGAALFLVFWYGLRFLSRRRKVPARVAEPGAG